MSKINQIIRCCVTVLAPDTETAEYVLKQINTR